MDILNFLSPICDCCIPMCDSLLPNNPAVDELVFNQDINGLAALPNNQIVLNHTTLPTNQNVLNNAAGNLSTPVDGNFVGIRNNVPAIAKVVNETPGLLSTLLNESPEARVDEALPYEHVHPSNTPQMLRIIE
jgi:hypothetical protein